MIFKRSVVLIVWVTINTKKCPSFIDNFNMGGGIRYAKNHKRQRRKRQSVTAKREKSQTPKFV